MSLLLGSLASFNMGAPSGTYKLDVSSPYDRIVLQCLLQLHTEEAARRELLGLADISQLTAGEKPTMADHSPFRNVIWSNAPPAPKV